MKKTLLVASIAMISAFTASAQTFTWSTNSTIETNLALNTTVQLPTHQLAVGTDTVTLGIEVIHNDIPLTWDGMLCIYGTCLGVIPVVGTTAEMDPISGATEGMVRLTVNPMSGTEVAKLQVYVFDIDFPDDGDTATFLLNTTLSIDEASILSADLKLFPNPSSDDVTINASTGLKQVSIYSTSGQLVQSYILNNELIATIDVRSISTGIYTIQVEDNQGNTVNKKFVKE